MKTQDILVNERRLVISDRLNGSLKAKLVNEIAEGLSAPQKFISSKFFYDSKGSGLFEEITRLPEYYPGRTEKSILRKHAPQLVCSRAPCDVIELGSGDCSKIRMLFESMERVHLDEVIYIPVDFSRSSIEKAAEELLARFPELRIQGYVADFLNRLDYLPRRGKRLFCFFGGTIGNLAPDKRVEFLNAIGQNMTGQDEFFLGVDMVKERALLERAYNDSALVTAQFNRNILNVVNSIINADFEPLLFEHHAFFNEEESRIEMHLEALEKMEINSPVFPRGLTIRRGEMIHTENSYKFTLDHIRQMGRESGLSLKAVYQDDNEWFSLVKFGV